MKLRSDLILQFELKDFEGCIEASKIGTRSFYLIFDMANGLLQEEMQKWPVLDTRDNKVMPNFARVLTRVMPEPPKEETAKTILEEILRLVQQSDKEITSQVRVASIEREIEKAKKLLGKL